MRPQARPIEFQSYGTKEVVNYSAIANKAKQLSDNIRTVAFDQVNDSITFKSSLIHDKPPVSIKPSDNSINNVSSINCTDGSTITGITSDSTNTDPTKAISSLIINDLNERIESLEDKTQNQTATANETTFTGNVTADTFNGYNVGFNKKFPSILTVESNGLTNISKHLDFHWLNYQSSCRLAFDDLNLTCDRSITAPNLKSNNETRLAKAEKKNTEQDKRLDALESKDIAHEERLGSIEAMDTAQNEIISNINTKNTEQDERLNVIESELPNKANVGHKHVFNDITDLKTLSTKALFDRMYPTGSIYMSFTKQPPPFGQWELLEEGYFLQSTTTTSGEKGGTTTHTHSTADHTLTIDEIPAHDHNQRSYLHIVQNDSLQTSVGWDPYEYGIWTGNDYRNKYTAATTNTGGGQAHNHGDTGESSNIPPYIKCYMYKRTDDTSTTTEIPDEITTIGDTVDLTGYVKHEELAEIETTIETKNNEQDARLNALDESLGGLATRVSALENDTTDSDRLDALEEKNKYQNVTDNGTVFEGVLISDNLKSDNEIRLSEVEKYFDKVYPIGSVWVTVSNTTPPIGTWKIQNNGYAAYLLTNSAGTNIAGPLVYMYIRTA